MSKELAASGQLSAEEITRIKFRILRGEGYTDDEILTVFDMALSSLRGTEQCVVNPVMSCVCSQGTKSCTVNHGTFADGIEALCPQDLVEAYAIPMDTNGHSQPPVHLMAVELLKYRALAQDQRSPKQGIPTELPQTQVADSDHPTEQDADELLREALDAYDHIVVKTGYQGDFDTSAGRAHLARKEPK